MWACWSHLRQGGWITGGTGDPRLLYANPCWEGTVWWAAGASGILAEEWTVQSRAVLRVAFGLLSSSSQVF